MRERGKVFGSVASPLSMRMRVATWCVPVWFCCVLRLQSVSSHGSSTHLSYHFAWNFFSSIMSSSSSRQSPPPPPTRAPLVPGTRDRRYREFRIHFRLKATTIKPFERRLANLNEEEEDCSEMDIDSCDGGGGDDSEMLMMATTPTTSKANNSGIGKSPGGDDDVAKTSPFPPPTTASDADDTDQPKIIVLAHKCIYHGCKQMIANGDPLTHYRHNLDHHHTGGVYRCFANVCCAAQFASRDQLLDHESTAHPANDRWRCPVCIFFADSYQVVADHYQRYHWAGRYKCGVEGCDFPEVKLRADLYRHHNAAHRKGSVFYREFGVSKGSLSERSANPSNTTHQPYLCLSCNLKFEKLDHFSRHNMEHDLSSWPCRKCGYVTYKFQDLLEHEMDWHLREDEPTSGSSKTRAEIKKRRKEMRSSQEEKEAPKRRKVARRGGSFYQQQQKRIVQRSNSVDSQSSQEEIVCYDCLAWFDTYDDYQQHIASEYHQSRV